MSKTGWIGVDLDATLAVYNYGDLYKNGNTYIGEPVQPMLDRVKAWLSEGKEVRIFTARVSEEHPGDLAAIREAIEAWCEKHIGQKLQITNVKDYSMVVLYDDRAVQVIPNTGIPIAESEKYAFDAYNKGYNAGYKDGSKDATGLIKNAEDYGR